MTAAEDPYKGKFVFINKSASNLEGRDKDEAFTVSSHVTHTYYHWRKAKNLELEQARLKSGFKRGRSKQTPRQEQRSRKSTSPKTDGGRMNFPITQHYSPVTWHDEVPLVSTRSVSQQLDQEKTLREKKQARRSMARSISQEQCNNVVDEVSLGYIDPFNTGPIKITQFHLEMTQLWQAFFMWFAFPLGGSSKLKAKAELLWAQRVHDIFQDPMQMDAWLAGALTLKGNFLTPEERFILWPKALQLNGSSVASLRQHLISDDVYSERTIMSIWNVASMTYYSADWITNRAHADVLLQIVQALGGLDELSELTLIHVLHADILNSTYMLKRPDFHGYFMDCGSWMDQPQAELFQDFLPTDNIHYARWDEAFLINEDDVSKQFLFQLNNWRELINVNSMLHTLSSSVNIDHKDSIAQWVHDRHACLTGEAMHLYCDIEDTLVDNLSAASSPSSEYPCPITSGFRSHSSILLNYRLQQALLIACICHVHFIRHYNNHAFPKWNLYVPIPHLRTAITVALSRILSRCNSTSHSCPRLSHLEPLLYLLFVGACSEQAAIHSNAGAWPSDDPMWFSKRFGVVAGKLGLRTWREGKKVLRRFVYEEGVGDRFAEVLFEGRVMGKSCSEEEFYAMLN